MAVDELRAKLSVEPKDASPLVRLVSLIAGNSPHVHRPSALDGLDERAAEAVLSLGVEVDAFPIDRTNFDGNVDEARHLALELSDRWTIAEFRSN